MRTVGNQQLPYPDWVSLVHYSSRPVTYAKAAQLPSINVSAFPHPELPVPLEWTILEVQDLIYSMRMSKLAPVEYKLPSPKPIAIFGPIADGAKSLVVETVTWLADTDLQVSGSTILDFGHGLMPLLRLLLGQIMVTWSDQEIVDRILERTGPDQAFGFLNLDLALDSGRIDEHEFVRIVKIAEALSKHENLVIIHVSRDLSMIEQRNRFGINMLGLRCWPIATSDIEEWILSSNSIDPGARDQAVSRLLCWISAGHVDLAKVIRDCSSSSEREDLLSYLVHATPEDHPSNELWLLREQVRWRWLQFGTCVDRDSVIPMIAGLGSGVVIDELPIVGEPIKGIEFPLIPKKKLEQIAPTLIKLVSSGLAANFNGYGFPKWRQVVAEFALYRLNPLLRPLIRADLPNDVVSELDEWTVVWAADKLHFFSHEWLDPRKHEKTEIYIEQAWSLFAIAIWVARRDTKLSRVLLEAIHRATLVGWWPKDLDLSVIIGPVPVEALKRRSEFDDLWSIAVDRQRQGDFEGARDLLLRAVTAIGGEVGGYPFFVAHYRLGTICIDLQDFDAAAEHLSIAEEGGLNNFIAENTLAYIKYEQGVVARRRGMLLDGEERSGMLLNAEERFRSAIAMAQAQSLHQLESLCFQELTDSELHVPPIGLYGDGFRNVNNDDSSHLMQAELYLEAARAAASRMEEPEIEEGSLLLLEARILAEHGEIEEARVIGKRAAAAFESVRDHRVSAAHEFLKFLSIS